MPVTIHSPSYPLSDYISYYYCIDEISSEMTELKKRIPDGTVELFFHYGNPFYKVSRDEDPVLIEERSLLLGQMHDYLKFRSTDHIAFIAVKFKPHGFQPFLNDSVNQFTDKIITIGEIWGSESEALENGIINLKTTEDRIQLIEQFLIKRLKKESDQLLDHCTQLIFQHNGNMKVSDLAASVNLSVRQLERKFLDTIGINPNCFSRISRIQKTLQKMEGNDYTNLTQLSYDNGFYDQSHLIKEMGKFAGLSPKNIRLMSDCYSKTAFM